MRVALLVCLLTGCSRGDYLADAKFCADHGWTYYKSQTMFTVVCEQRTAHGTITATAHDVRAMYEDKP